MLLSHRSFPKDCFRAGFFLTLGVVLAFVLALAARHFLLTALAICTPFVVGLVLALLLDPLADKLMRCGMGRMPAAGVVFGVFLLLLVGIGWLAIPALIAQVFDLIHNGPQYIASLQGYVNHLLVAHPKIGPFKMPATAQQLNDKLSGSATALLQNAGGRVYGVLVGSVTLVIQLVLTLIITFFLLVDIDHLRARLFYLAPEKWRGMMSQMGRDVGGVFSDYLRGLLIVCALYGAATIGLLYLLSVRHHGLAHYALLVGAAAGILYAIPYLGSTATALVTFLVAFVAATADGQSGLGFGGLAVALTLALNQVFDNVITPRVVGGGVGLHPVMALFALVIGGALFSIWGMLLSVPIAGSIQVILFRLYPRLTQPTPPPFLLAQGVLTASKESQKILRGDEPLTAERQQDEDKA